MTDFVEKVVEFNDVAGTKAIYDTRKSALYVGLILEELGEMLEATGFKDSILNYHVSDYAAKFKSGAYDTSVEFALQHHGDAFNNRKEFLDAAVDISVVALGAGIAVGGDVVGATHAVADNNLSKFPVVDGVRTVLRDENGKVKKPEGFVPVDLTPFIK